MKKRKKIALITTWYPPNHSVATNRMEAFAQYLSEDFDLEVFTLGASRKVDDNKRTITVFYSSSNWLFEKLRDKQTDHALFHKFKVLIRILISKIIKNPLNQWKNATVKKLIASHNKIPFDLMISSFSPQEAHLVAIEFRKHYPETLWIADMRDEMSHNSFISGDAKRQLLEVEQLVDKYAIAVTSVSDPILKYFKKEMRNVKYFEEIRNGFNHEYRRNVENTAKSDVFTVGYFGTFYGSIKPDIFFTALAKLVDKGQKIKVELYGVHQNFHIPRSLQESITIHPPVDYHQAIQLMMLMDVNLLLHPTSERKGVFTGKLFDYLSVQKPIFACIDTNDVAAELINDLHAGYVMSFEDEQEIEHQLEKAISDWQNGVNMWAETEDVENLHRKKQVEKLKKLIEILLEK